MTDTPNRTAATASELLDCLEGGIAKLERRFVEEGNIAAGAILRAVVGVFGYAKSLDARIVALEGRTND